MILKPPTHAINTFGQNGTVFYNNYPLHKFLFAVVFNINPVSGLSFDTQRLTVIVKNVQIGGWAIETDDVNEYNRHRLVHKRIEYDNTVITMHDVADGKTMRMAEKYYRYYFGDGRPAVGFGYDTALIPDNNRRYVFDSIDIYQFQAKKANRTRLKYPKMVGFKQDNAEYSAVDGLMEIQFTFKPEYVEYERGISLPGDVLAQLAKGGTPESLASIIDTQVITQNSADVDTLRDQLIDDLADSTKVSIQNQAVNNFAGTAITKTAVGNLVSGSAVTRASTSSLDSFGRVVQDIKRKIPPSTQKPTKKSFEIRPDKVKKVDGSSDFAIRSNTYDYQGGDE
jgi:hypothetical protein